MRVISDPASSAANSYFSRIIFFVSVEVPALIRYT
jgi:hypothetical protein